MITQIFDILYSKKKPIYVKTAFQEISKSYYIIAPSCWESVTRTSTSIFWDTWAGDVLYDVQGNKSPLLKNDEDSAERPRASLVCPISQPSFFPLE